MTNLPNRLLRATKFFLIGISLLPLCAGADKDKDFNALKPALFKVRTSASEEWNKNSYGTAFVVNKNGLLITNYHFLADALWSPQKNKVWVDLSDTSLQAEILKVDFINDLVLLRVNHKFTPSLNLSAQQPKQDDQLYSLGLNESLTLTSVSQVYNGIKNKGSYRLIELTSPLGGGMSGGPIVNTKNEVVAINVFYDRYWQALSFGVPVQSAIDLINAVSKESFKQEDPLTSLKNQLAATDKSIRNELVQTFHINKKLTCVKLPNFSTEKDQVNYLDKRTKFYDSEYEGCESFQSISMGNNLEVGHYDISFSIYKNNSKNFISWHNFKGANWNPATRLVKTFDKEMPFNFAQPKCIRERVENKDKKIKTISVCYQQLLPLTEFYNANILIHSDLTPSSFYRAEIILKGLSLESINAISIAALNFEYGVENESSK